MHGNVTRKTTAITQLFLRLTNPSATRGRLEGGGFSAACAIGRSGLSALKREGDGATPRATLRVIGGYQRREGLRLPPSPRLALKTIGRTDGWCDDPRHPAYNRPVRLPFRASHEELWRADGLYDVVLVLDWNIPRTARWRGSAIFLHLARPGYAPTAGCIALKRQDLRRLLARLSPRASIRTVADARPVHRS